MKAQQFMANWKIVTGKLRQRFAMWMADDERYRDGKETELIGRILKGSERKTRGKRGATMAPCEPCGR